MYFYLDFSENFGTVPHSIHLDKLPSCGKGVSGALCFLPKNWLKGRTWRFTLFLCLAFFKSIWFVHLGLLAFLPYFLLVEINCFWGQIFLWYCRALNTVTWCHSLFFLNQDCILHDMKSGFLSICVSSFIRTKWKDTMKYIDSGHLDIASSAWLQASRELLLEWLISLFSSMGQFGTGQVISILFDSHEP